MVQYTQINPDALVTALTPINNSLGGKQDKTDSTLATTDKTISGAINEINTKVGNLTGALTWKGKFDTLPAVTDYEAGNVVGVGNKEYVLTVTGSTKAWEELGDEGSYLLKSVAEETYLKKADGAVTTANIADSAVTSTKLAKGVRNPIILTPDTTEVDEETYQKLISDDVDVLLKTDITEGEGNLCTFTYETDMGDYLSLYFTCFSVEGSDIIDSYLYAYRVDITKTSPHTCSITENQNGGFESFLDPSYLKKSSLFPVLQEIDLDVSSDENRKSRLELFEENWKELQGTNNLDGARFIGNVPNLDNSGNSSVLFIRQSINENYAGCAMNSDSDRRVLKYEIGLDGSLTITPLFSHLEAITIYTNNTEESMQANLNNIAAYEANLHALGVDTSKSVMIPVIYTDGYVGFIQKNDSSGMYCGILATDDGTMRDTYIDPSKGEYGETKYAKVENVVNKSDATKYLEAITIQTLNIPANKKKNSDAIQAYVNNLKSIGVDVTKGYTIPIKTVDFENGVGVIYPNVDNTYKGICIANEHSYIITISQDGTWNKQDLLDAGSDYSILNTSAKDILSAINEINTLAKKKQDTLTSGINIKTINNQSILGSGNINITGGVTKCRINVNTLVAEPTGNEPLIFKMPLSDVQKYKNYDVVEIYSAENGVETTMYTVYHGAFSEFYATSNGTGWLTGMFIGDETTTDENKIGFVLITSETADTVDKDAKEPISSRAVYTALQGKQDTLTSGTNIKTINNQSLLGSGNIEISAPSITVDTTMSDTSTNPVQNKVIKAYIDELVGNVEAQLAQI